MREIDAAESCRGDGFSDFGERATRWRGDVVAERHRADEAAARKSWIYFSVVSVAAHADRVGQRRVAAATCREDECPRGSTRASEVGGAGRAGSTLPPSALGWANAARRNCARADSHAEVVARR